MEKVNHMKKELEIQKFIRWHSDWESRLAEKPYCINIQKDTVYGRHLVLFKYSQVDSDFNFPITRECRGLILDIDTLEPVCVPFFKFFNYGEPYCDKIDWDTAFVSEKLDGSIMKVVLLGNDLLVSTNGVIDAFKAPIQDQIGFVGKTFGDLFVLGLKYYNLDMESFKNLLDEGYTYIFELTSPYTKVVVSWPTTQLHFIGCRDNKTLQEIRFMDHPLSKIFHTPDIYPITSIEECERVANEFDCNHEGFVVCDGKFHRVKQKSLKYCSLHHMKNNGALSFERGIDIVRQGELDEVLTYFPEFSEHLSRIQNDIDILREKLLNAWFKFKCVKHFLTTRKEQALTITSEDCFGKYSGVGFALLDDKIASVDEWIDNVPSKNLVKFLGYKEKCK